MVVKLNERFELKVFANGINRGDLELSNLNVDECRFLTDLTVFMRFRRILARALEKDSGDWEARYRIDHAETALKQAILGFKPDLIYTDYGTTAVLLRCFAKKYSIPLIVHFHGYDASSALSQPWYRTQFESLMEDAAAVIVPSVHMERLIRIATGVSRQIDCIPYGPDLHIARELVGY